ncbi:IS30 family transposase [Listeria immobilis]|uniref:IS30 family transposase n=1 Tax=Listeria immobilis TaxID=2713502 RepID=UPI001C8A2875|nr:IS30 family transposase [Listeria immobilis]MBC6303690.1 IS30 family transposase [Listeria immobilis]
MSEYGKYGNSAFPGNGSSIKVPSFSGAKPSLVYACIKKHLKGKASIKRLCYYVGVSCSGYYVFLNRSPSNLEIENAVFSEYIRNIFFEHKGRYGARRIQITLKRTYDLSISRKLIDMFQRLPEHKVKTVTLDKGKEFAKHAEVSAALNELPFYFADPHAPWQRGTNENTNGLLREYFPKNEDMTKYSHQEISDSIYELNTRPRKCLGWKTPYEVFFDTMLHLT